MDTEITAPEEKKPQNGSLLHDIFDFTEMLALAVCAVFLLFTMLARLSVVEGTSMEKTLAEKDFLLISDLFYTPKAGDIVVIQSPKIDNGKAIVKRVIATEGQTVEIKSNRVYVDGIYLPELDGSLGYKTNFSNGYMWISEYGPLTVPEGKIFVLGDHRSVSMDSRYFGCVDTRAVLGKVYLRLFPFSGFGTV